MKYRTRTYYTDSQKALMWERWKKGWTLHQIAHLFNRAHASVRGSCPGREAFGRRHDPLCSGADAGREEEEDREGRCRPRHVWFSRARAWSGTAVVTALKT